MEPALNTSSAPAPAAPPNPAATARQFAPVRRERRFHADTANLIAMAGDFAMIVAGLLFGFWLRFRSGLIPVTPTWWTTGDTTEIRLRSYLGLIAIGAFILFGTLVYRHLYRPQNLLRFRHSSKIIAQGAFLWLFAYVGLSLVLKFQPPISRIYVLVSFFTTIGCVLVWRYLFHRLLRAGRLARQLRQRILFVGWNSEAARLVEVIHGDPSQPYDVVGCLPSAAGSFEQIPRSLIRPLGEYAQFPEILRREDVDMVVLTDLRTSTDDIIALTNHCERELIQFKVVPSYFQILISGLHLETISGVPILGVAELPLDRIPNRVLKRTMDIVGALVGLVLSAPIIAVCGVLIYLESPGPIFYRQTRTGRNGQGFQIIKLRSMRLDAEKQGAQWAKKDDDRRLRIGAFLREWNLDEVPQFWNVLKGDMSLVGPRPERPELIANFQYDIPHYNARLSSKPGVTGWAQIHGLRGNTDLSERVRYDLFYLENWSLWLDIQIMVLTFVQRKNAY